MSKFYLSHNNEYNLFIALISKDFSLLLLLGLARASSWDPIVNVAQEGDMMPRKLRCFTAFITISCRINFFQFWQAELAISRLIRKSRVGCSLWNSLGDTVLGPAPCSLQPLLIDFGSGTSIRGHTVDMREETSCVLWYWDMASWMVISITRVHWDKNP